MLTSSNEQKPTTYSKQQKYQRFKQWFQQNGGLSRDISFPTLFQPGSYIGMSAQKQIPPNTVILAVPKRLTISVSHVKQSQLKQIITKQEILNNKQDDDTDYNILCLFLIMEKMKKEKSFFYPYIQLLDSSQTLINWEDHQIQQIKDPYINLDFIDSMRVTFQPTFDKFVEISQGNKQIFPYKITRQLFDQMYAVVMTRGFGWGLPETMLVPYADFLNHSSQGVHHYVFDKHLQNGHKSQEQAYIRKKFELDLTIFLEIDNKMLLPINYEMNRRQKYIFEHKQKLNQLNLKYDSQHIRMNPNITTSVYYMLIQQVIRCDFDDELCLSTDSEDNDSESGEDQDEQERGQMQKYNPNQKYHNKEQHERIPSPQKKNNFNIERKYLRYAFKQANKDLDERYSQPKPNVNSQFQEDTKFDWWDRIHLNQGQAQTSISTQYPTKQNQNQPELTQRQQKQHGRYFIVSSSKVTSINQQIFNCYGRRSNRFLLTWYGFCFQNNKYDSVPFRVWSQQVYRRTNQPLYTKYLTQRQYLNGVPLGNERYNVAMLSDEFRLKMRKIEYKFISFMRYRYLKAHKIYREYYKDNQIHVNSIVAVEMEIQVFLIYQKYLNELKGIFGCEEGDWEDEATLTEDNTGFTTKARRYFSSLLEQSNRQIIQRNILAVNEILRALLFLSEYIDKQQTQHKLNQPKQTKHKQTQQSTNNNKQVKSNRIKWQVLPKSVLTQLYQSCFKNILKGQLNGQNESKIKLPNHKQAKLIIELKIMVRQYFRMLSKSTVCKTLQVQFE